MKLTPGRNNSKCDLVFTPEYLAIDIIKHFPLKGKILDPCKGNGVFYNNYPNSCQKQWCEIHEGKCFYNFHEKVNWIVTNPPWSDIKNFLKHGMEIADNVVFLSSMTHFCTSARLRLIKQNNFGIKEFYCVSQPKKNWPNSGFQLVAAHLQKNYSGTIKLSGNIGS